MKQKEKSNMLTLDDFKRIKNMDKESTEKLKELFKIIF